MIVSLLFGTGLALASPLTEGVERWEEGDLAAAVEAWSSVVDEGVPSWETHYNLGVARYRQGDLALALAHWREATHRAPRREEPSHNLAVVRAELGLGGRVVAEPWWLRLATANEWLGLGAFTTALGGLGGWLAHSFSRRVWPWMAGAILGLVFLAAGYVGDWQMSAYPGAVVLVEDCALRLEPDVEAPTGKTLGVGAEVGVLERFRGFVLVESSEGLTGYVPASSLAIVGDHSGWERRLRGS